MTADAYRKWILERLDIGKELLYLTQEDVKKVPFSQKEFYDLTEQALIAYSKKEVDMPAKIGIHPIQDTFYHAMPCYVPALHASGIKWGSCYPDNPKKFGFSQANGLIIYNDTQTGIPIGIMDCIYVTEKRTSAVSYVSAHYTANQNATTLGMIGCGVEGTQHVRGICDVLPHLKTIYIYDIVPEAMDALIKELQPSVPAKIVKAASHEELVKNSEVIISATMISDNLQPDVKDEWVTKGQTLILVDCHSMFEDATLKRADKYIQDSVEQHALLTEYGYYPHGFPPIYGETGEIAAGLKKGRESSDELIVVNNVGMAVEDLFVVRHMFDRALEQKIGMKLPL